MLRNIEARQDTLAGNIDFTHNHTGRGIIHRDDKTGTSWSSESVSNGDADFSRRINLFGNHSWKKRRIIRVVGRWEIWRLYGAYLLRPLYFRRIAPEALSRR